LKLKRILIHFVKLEGLLYNLLRKYVTFSLDITVKPCSVLFLNICLVSMEIVKGLIFMFFFNLTSKLFFSFFLKFIYREYVVILTVRE
jgi:hypothetical protein